MKKILIYTGFVIVSTIIGYLIWDLFIRVSLYQLDIKTIKFVTTRITSQFSQHTLFALSFGLIPLLYLSVNKAAKLQARKQKLFTLGFIILTGLIIWEIRLFDLNRQFNLYKSFSSDSNETLFTIEGLKIEIFLLAGFVVGTIISLIIYRIRNRKETEKLMVK